MKKSILLLVGLVLLLAACGANAAEQDSTSTNKDKDDVVVEKSDQETATKEADSEYKTFAEYETLVEITAEEDLTLNVVEDNQEKRIILLEDANGQEKYKAIFVKKTNRLKIIQFEKGQVFNEVIGDKVEVDNDKNDTNKVENKQETNKEQTELAEYDALVKHANADKLQLKIVEDNDGKRVILLEDENGKERYKAIFVKKTNHLKIIEFDKGQIFNEKI